MEEKNILNKYQERLQEIEEILKSINHTLNELKIEKGKISKYEYDSKWQSEENQAINYKDNLQKEKARLESIIKAYDMVKIYKKSIENLEKIKISSPQEKIELESDRKKLEVLLEQNINVLPSELQEAISRNTIDIKEEILEQDLQDELNLTGKSSKTIEDYKNEILINKNELKHLEEELKKLDELKDIITKKEYLEDFQKIKKYIRREKGKLLRNTQIVNCYEIILNDLEKLQEINTTIARDEQEKNEIERDKILLQNEIDKNKKLVPKNIINNLINQNLQSKVVKPNGNATKKVNNSPSNNLENNVSPQNKKINFEKLNNLSTEELKSRYSELVEILEKYKDIEEQKLPEDFSNVANETETIANILVSRGASLPLQDNFEKNNISEEVKPEVEPSESVMKPITSFNDELNDVLNKTIANLGTHHKNEKNVQPINEDEELENQFRTIFQKNLQNAEQQQQEEIDKAHKENLKSILRNPSKKEETHKEKIKQILTPNSSDSNTTEEKESKTQAESKEKSTENSKVNLNSSKEQNKENEQPKEKKKSKEVKSVRKPKKNIFKRLIAKISSIAVTLVLICAGGTAIAKKITTPKMNTAIENNTDELDNSSDIQTTYSNGDEIYHPELLTDEEIQSLTKVEDSNTDFVNMQPIIDPVNEENDYSSDNDDGFLLDNNANPYEYDDTNSYIENDSSNLTYLDDDIDQYVSYETDGYNNYDKNSIRIGSEVTVNGNIHRNVFDAYFQENAFTPTFNNDTKRIVLGVGIANGQGIVRKYAYNENANQDIQQMINNGGEVVTVLTAKKEKYLASCGNNMQITREQLDAIEEGWYNINDINLENVKGLSK